MYPPLCVCGLTRPGVQLLVLCALDMWSTGDEQLPLLDRMEQALVGVRPIFEVRVWGGGRGVRTAGWG